ncbi:hypothetical protein [Moritella sp. PE36]|uniref:hypothetical protein n=1 Tax=Moritella sp. PE36 TaxID=58051 RepID=UPI0002FB4793|nr:hypothetical protein [Moritella sp. PE36]
MAIADILLKAGVFIAAMMNIAALLVTYDKIKNFKGEKAKELHGRYIQVKQLSENLEANYSEILIILSGITRADLSIDEIRWFITEPRAFLKLEKYGKVSGRYCNIDLDKGEFVLKEIVSTRKKRIVERSKILGISFCLLAFISAVWLFTVKDVQSITTVYIALSFWTAYFLVLLWGANLLLTTLSNAKKMVGTL